MSARLIRLPALVCLAVWLVPTSAMAGPITFGPTTDFDARHLADVLVLGRNHTLSLDDLRVLEARDDNGWHLGWFKPKFRPVGEDDPSEGLDWNSTIWPTIPSLEDGMSLATLEAGQTIPGLLFPGKDKPFVQQVLADDGGQSLNDVAIPEPASLLLLGSGLLVVVRRRFRNRSR